MTASWEQPAAVRCSGTAAAAAAAADGYLTPASICDAPADGNSH